MMKTRNASRLFSRRGFLKCTALAAGGVTIVPAHVLGLGGAKPPSEKLNLAAIGVAGQGASDLGQLSSENIVALCDVDWAHAAGTFQRFPDAKKFKDFRKMLDEVTGIDGVIVATPDHVHAVASAAAMRRGKHVYCEKPLTHSVAEARKVAELAREKKVATQMGNQGQASEATRRLIELVADGAVGPVREAHVWTDRPSRGLFDEYWPQGVDRPKDEPAVPTTLDWDLWLGPAPSRPYNGIYLPFRWRGWWDFGTGALGDIGCHSLDPIFRALKLGHPVSVQASSARVNKETYPLASMVTYEFPARGDMPPVKVVWYDGGLRPPRPESVPAGQVLGDNGRLIIGDRGVLVGDRRAGDLIFPESRRAEYKPPEPTLPRSIGHYKEWIEAARGGKPAGSNFDWAGPLTEVVLLGNVALRVQLREKLTREKLLWDPIAFRFTNVPEANEFLGRQYREGWTL